MASMCARSWCVRPVIGRRASQAASGAAASVTYSETARLPAGSSGLTTTIRSRSSTPSLASGRSIRPGRGRGRAAHEGPVGLARVPPGEGRRQPRRGVRRLAEREDAGGVAVEPVDEPGPGGPLAPGREQAVDVLEGLGAALDRQAGGLVEDEDIRVLVEHEAAGEGDVPPLAAPRSPARLLRSERRHPHRRARRKPRVRLGPTAIDPDLARARQLVDLRLAQLRPAPAKPAVEAHAVLGGRDGDQLHIMLAHAPTKQPRARESRGALQPGEERRATSPPQQAAPRQPRVT